MAEPMPRRIRVGPYAYAVRSSAADIAQVRADERDANVLGLHVCERSEIVVSPDLTPDGRRVTLLHELMHACAWVAGAQESVTTKAEEALIAGIAPVLLETLRRNASLTGFLVGPDRAGLRTVQERPRRRRSRRA